MIKFNIFEKSYKVSNVSYLDSICLFGSYARGDHDESSDIDILIVVDDCDEEVLISRKQFFERELKLPYHWLSVYRKSSIRDLHEHGSYFLWHIKFEGKILYAKSSFLKDILDSLPPYRKTTENLIEYRDVCRDIKKSVNIDSSTLQFELSILASIVRNTCIAICYLNQLYDFGKYSAVKQSMEILGNKVPFTMQDYENLYLFRLLQTRKLNIGQVVRDKINTEYVQNWVERADILIALALSEVKGGHTDE